MEIGIFWWTAAAAQYGGLAMTRTQALRGKLPLSAVSTLGTETVNLGKPEKG